MIRDMTQIKNYILEALFGLVLIEACLSLYLNFCWFQGFLSVIATAAVAATFFNGMHEVHIKEKKDFAIMILAAIFIAAVGVLLPYAYADSESMLIPGLVTTTFTSLWLAFTLMLTDGLPRGWWRYMLIGAYIVLTFFMLSTVTFFIPEIPIIFTILRLGIAIGMGMVIFSLIVQFCIELHKKLKRN